MSGEESYIQVPADQGGRRIHTLQVSKGGYTVQEEAIGVEAHQITGLPVYIAAALDKAVGANVWQLLVILTPDCTKWIEVMLVKVIAQATAAVVGFPMAFRLYRTGGGWSGSGEIFEVKLNTDSPDLPSGISSASGSGATPYSPISACLASGSINPEDSGAAVETVLFDEKVTGQPLLVKDNAGIGVQQYGTTGVGLVDVVIVFRTRDKET